MLFLVSTPATLALSSIFSAIGLIIAISSLRINVKRGIVDDLRTEVNLLTQQVKRCEETGKTKDERIQELEEYNVKQDKAIKTLEEDAQRFRDREFNLLFEIHELTKKFNELKGQKDA